MFWKGNPRSGGKRGNCKIALFARSKAGKSSILAALAMLARPHPAGLSCEWIKEPQEYARPVGERTAWNKNDAAAQVYRGVDWLEEAIRCVQNREVPPATEPGMLLRFVFDLGEPGEPVTRVELIDYGGENIKAEVAGQELPGLIRNLMKTMDGILVVVETPLPGQEAAMAEEDLQLRQAFAALQGEKRTLPLPTSPVGLLFSKFDRRHDFGGPGHPAKALDVLLECCPAHAALAGAIRASLGLEDNFAKFPVSAFGEVEIAEVAQREGGTRQTERPKALPLRSAGLLEPWFWVVRRRDQIEFAALKERTADLGWLNAFSPLKPWQLWRRAGSLKTRFPVRKERHREVRQLAGRCFFIGTVRGLLLLLLVMMGGLLVEFVVDGVEYRTVQAAMTDGNASDDDKDYGERWLTSYYTGSVLRHSLYRFFVSNHEAIAQLEAFRGRREDQDWAPVAAKAPDPLAQADPAKHYLKHHQSGTHRADALAIVAEAAVLIEEAEAKQILANPEANQEVLIQAFVKAHPGSRQVPLLDSQVKRIHLEKKQWENDAVLRALQARTKQAIVAQAELKTLKDEADRPLPHPDAETKDQAKWRMDVRNEIDNELLKSITDVQVRKQRKEWLAFSDSYGQHLAEGAVREAARLLAERVPDTSERAALLRQFPGQALAALQRRQRAFLEDHLFDDGRKYFKEVLDDGHVAKLLENKKEKLDEIRQLYSSLDGAEDRYLYDKVCQDKNLASAERYLKAAPLKKMEALVKEFRQYWRRKNGDELVPTITLVIKRIDWIDHWDRPADSSRPKNIVTVTCNGSDEIVVSGLGSKRNVPSENVGHKVFNNVRLTDSWKVEAQIRLPATWKEGDGYCSGERAGQIQSFSNVAIDLTGNCTNRIVLSLEGLPTLPVLPPWRD